MLRRKNPRVEFAFFVVVLMWCDHFMSLEKCMPKYGVLVTVCKMILSRLYINGDVCFLPRLIV